MKIAIISDIHSNLEALTTVLTDIQQRNVSQVLCLGDIVGYGPNPSECIELMIEEKIQCILGNHDQAVFDHELTELFSETAREAIEWTRAGLSESERNFLQSLPYRLEWEGATFVHASPGTPEEFNYVFTYSDAFTQFQFFTSTVCFVGHTHRAKIFSQDGTPPPVQPGKKYIINVGSVGQPRDSDPRACYGLFDTDSISFEHVRLEYDVDTVRKKILTCGLPHRLGERLLYGV